MRLTLTVSGSLIFRLWPETFSMLEHKSSLLEGYLVSGDYILGSHCGSSYLSFSKDCVCSCRMFWKVFRMFLLLGIIWVVTAGLVLRFFYGENLRMLLTFSLCFFSGLIKALAICSCLGALTAYGGRGKEPLKILGLELNLKVEPCSVGTDSAIYSSAMVASVPKVTLLKAI